MALVQISLKVPDEDLAEADRIAKRKGISRAEYLRRALAVQLDRDARTEQAAGESRRADRGGG
jgi:metal-responsive CopG/Arc/MetJ family transcriptional regulator